MAAKTAVQPHVLREEKIAQIKRCLQHANDDTWEAADLILELAGPAKTYDKKLRQLAAEIGQGEIFCATLRKLASAFPPARRTYKLPWTAYRDAMNAGEDAHEVLRRMEAACEETVAGHEQIPSSALARELTIKVAEEHGRAPQRYFRRERSATDRLVAAIQKYQRALESGREQPTVEDIQELRRTMRHTDGFLAKRIR